MLLSKKDLEEKEGRLKTKLRGSIPTLIRDESAKLLTGLQEDIEYLHKNVEDTKNDIENGKSENALVKKS